VLGRSAAEENGNPQLIFHEALVPKTSQFVIRFDVMECWTSYDFLAWGACCSMTLTTLPG